MKLQFSRNGRQFFFVTLVVAERKAALSRIARGEKRPRLERLGEIVEAGLLAIHRVWHALAVSEFVVMPDHLHFLLIADYDRDERIEPLWVAHRLADAVELAAARVEERTGVAAPEPPHRESAQPLNGEKTEAMSDETRENARSENAQNRAAARALQIKRVDYMAKLLGEAVSLARAGGALKVEAGLRFGARIAAVSGGASAGSGGASGAAAPVRSVVFARDCFIELSFDSRQLKAIRHYIRLNPARMLWKLANPDLFRCHRHLRVARLERLAPRRFDGLGNLTLLGSPWLLHIRLTLKKTLAEHAPAIAEIIEKARRGWVIVSGFISPGEKELLRQLKAETAARFIKLLPFALPDRYDPSAEDSREIAAGRMAILSPFADTPPIAALEMKRNAAAARAFRANCLAMNDIAAALCENSNQTGER